MRNTCVIFALVLAVLGGSACAATDLPLPQSAIARLGAPLVTSVVASPSDSLVAIATPHGVELRDPSSLDLELRVPDTTKARVLAFSPAGDQLAILVDEPLGVLRIWDMTKSEVVAVVETGIPAATGLSFSRQRSILAVSDSHSVAFWDTTSWSEIAVLSVENGSGRAVAFSPVSDIVAVGSGDGVITFHLVESLLAQSPSLLDDPKIVASSHATSLLFSPDGETLAVGTDESTIELWVAEPWERKATLIGRRRTTFPLAFSPDGSLLVTAMDSLGLIELWDVGTHEKIQESSEVYQEQVQSLAFTSDAAMFFAVTATGTMARFETDQENGGYSPIWWGPSSSTPIASIAFSPDGEQLAVGASGCSKILSVTDWTVLHDDFDCGIPPRPHLVCYSPDSLYLMSQYSYLISLTDANTGRSLGSSMPHRSEINDMVVSPTGDVFASASQDKTVKIVDFENGLTLQTLDVTVPVNCLSFSPNGQWLAAGLNDGTTQVWSTTSFDVLLERAPQIHAIHDIAFSPDSAHLVTSDRSGNMLIWTTSSWGIVEQFRVSDWASPVSFSSDGLFLGVGGRLISVPQWMAVADLGGHYDSVSAVSFDPEGRFYATGSKDGTVLIWDLPAVIENSDVLLVEILVSSTDARIGEPVRFVLACDNCPDGSLQVAWTFGYGESANGDSVSHAFSQVGTHRVRVDVEDGQGNIGSAQTVIVVSEEP